MKKFITVMIISSLVLISAFALSGCDTEDKSGEYAVLAQCLTEKGVKFYGTYWCNFCEKQKEAFGEDFKYINSVECDPNGENANPEACKEARVQAYPAWYFPGQEPVLGVQSMESLAKKANCMDALNSSNSSESE